MTTWHGHGANPEHQLPPSDYHLDHEAADLRVELDLMTKDRDRLAQERDRLRDALDEYGEHVSWRCDHPDRYPWEPHCPCGLTLALDEFGLDFPRTSLPPATREQLLTDG